MFYHPTPCPSCGAGSLGFYRCRYGFAIVLVCDECDAVSTSAEAVASRPMLHPNGATGVFDDVGRLALGGEGSGWATREEIADVGWSKFIAGEM